MDVGRTCVVVSIAAAIVSSLTAIFTWNARHEQEKDQKREMHGWQTRFDHWNWLPADVGVSDTGYRGVYSHTERLSSYRGLVDKDLAEDYGRLCDIFSKSEFSDEERSGAITLLKKIRREGSHRARWPHSWCL